MATTLTNFINRPILLVFPLLINTLIFIGFWKGVGHVTNNPEGQTNNKWVQILRWTLLFVFSIITIELGTVIIFLSRFFLDRAYADGDQLVVLIIKGLGPLYSKILIILGLLISYFPLQVISKALKFTKPAFSALVLIFIWAFLMLFAGSLLGST